MSGISAGSLISMVRSPGIDTRVWLSFAEVTGVSVKQGENAGFYADLSLLPYEEEYTAWVGAPYAGSSAGFYFPLKVGDMVLVAIPYGDSASGIAIIGRFNAGDAVPPDEFLDGDAPSADIVLVAEEDVNLRLIVKGAGNVVIEPQGTGKVGIGAAPGEAGMEPIALGDQTTSALSSLKSYLAEELAKIAVAINAIVPGSYVVGIPPVLPNILAEKGEVK